MAHAQSQGHRRRLDVLSVSAEAEQCCNRVFKRLYSPFTRMGFMAIGGRSTAIKLSNGGVWVLASTTLDEPTRKVIDELGPVQYLVGADSVHYLFLGKCFVS